MCILWYNFGISALKKRLFRIISKIVIIAVFAGISILVYYLKKIKLQLNSNDNTYIIISVLIPLLISLLNLIA